MKPALVVRIVLSLLFPALTTASLPGDDDPKSTTKKIVFLPGPRSHGYGSHEHYAGACLLAKLLRDNIPGMDAVVYRDGWPNDPKELDNADAIVIDCDAGRVIVRHLEEFDKLMKRGVGLVCIHYAVNVPKENAGKHMLDWIGGYYELWWSVNPTWVADFGALPDHPITRGVKPFKIKDEWYYHMRFRENMQGVTPILTAVPPDSTRKRKDGPHSGNEYVRARMGMPEHVAWAYERPTGGRGFGFTGGHWHWNWAHDDFRKLMLNAIVWAAEATVPPDGVPSQTPTLTDLEANLDSPKPQNWRPEHIRQMIRAFNQPAAK